MLIISCGRSSEKFIKIKEAQSYEKKVIFFGGMVPKNE